MAKYRFTHTGSTVSPFTDSTYNVYIQLINTPNSGFTEAITFGNSASKTAAITSLKSQVEAAWSMAGLSSYYTWVSLTITEGTDSITRTFVYDVDASYFTSTSITAYSLGYMITTVGLWDAALQTIIADENISNTISATALCLPIPCDKCQEVTLKACQASYTIVTGLTASTAYTVLLTDRNDVRYTQPVTSDVSGNLTIDTTDIPSALFTPESGGFLFEVYTDSNLTTKATISVGVYQYGCIQLTFKHTTTTTNNL